MIPRIEPCMAPLSKERRKYLEETRGLKPYIQYAPEAYIDPDAWQCKMNKSRNRSQSLYGDSVCNFCNRHVRLQQEPRAKNDIFNELSLYYT